jgi:hypothetical protein
MEAELIILIVLVIFIILLLGYKYLIKKDYFKNLKKNEDFKVEAPKRHHILPQPKQENIKNNFENKQKVIQYFGGDYCPFSNVNSNAYKIMKDFESEYGDRVKVNYYWAGKDNEIMKELDVKYVPTILNNDNESIELKLPEGFDTTGLSNNDLRSILLETIYNNL